VALAPCVNSISLNKNMKNTTKISLQITVFLLFVSIIFFVVALFWYGNYKSIKEFWNNFFIYKNIVLLILITIFSIIIWFFSKIIIWNIFEKVEKNNKRLKDYNHYLAHELKTPISVISSNMDVLKYGFDEKIVEKSKQELKHMTKIIDWLLDFSETIRLEDKKNINLENFLKAQISFLDKPEQIKIKNNLFNFTIETDEILFERVVKNLIENAIKHSSDQKLEIIMQEDKLIFKNNVFKDLTEEELEKIKQKFYSKSKNWNGIGLSMIWEILKILNYKMEIFSENNIFRVEIIY